MNNNQMDTSPGSDFYQAGINRTYGDFEIGSDALVTNNSREDKINIFSRWYTSAGRSHVPQMSSHTNSSNENSNDSSIPSLEDIVRPESGQSVKVTLLKAPPTVGIDEDLQMILDLDPGIVDLGSTSSTTEPKITGLPPPTGG